MYKKVIFIIAIIVFLVIIFLINTKEEKNIKQKEILNIEQPNNEIKETNNIKEKEIFEDYYEQAEKKLNTLTIEEKIGQLFVVHYNKESSVEAVKKYHIGGLLFFESGFKEKTEKQVKDMIQNLQKNSKLPLLIAVDEEGGTVVRVSNNKNLVKSKFKSPQELYKDGGLEKIRQDTIQKSKILSNLGINLNLAPVVDIATNKSDYMYYRSIGKGAKLTSDYAKTVISASKNTNVSYTLKHFPGYGNNKDTHKMNSIDKRTYEEICQNDLEPFRTGIEEGAEAILISHNIVNSIDKKNPASLSKDIHKLLREDLKFTGIIITDDLSMKAVSEDKEATVKAILAGNDIIITDDCKASIEQVKKAIKNKKISKDTIDKMAFRIIAWKYYKGLLQD